MHARHEARNASPSFSRCFRIFACKGVQTLLNGQADGARLPAWPMPHSPFRRKPSSMADAAFAVPAQAFHFMTSG